MHRALLTGLSVPEIAAQPGLSPRTVDRRIAELRRRHAAEARETTRSLIIGETMAFFRAIAADALNDADAAIAPAERLRARMAAGKAWSRMIDALARMGFFERTDCQVAVTLAALPPTPLGGT